jgi:YVTN family beta-propeller protein
MTRRATTTSRPEVETCSRRCRAGSVSRFAALVFSSALLLLSSTVPANAQTITATVNVGTGPFSAAVNPVTNKIYVVNRNSNNVTVIDGATNTVTATVTVGTTPVYVGVNTVTNKIYVSNATSNNVSVIDGTTNTVTATVTTGGNPDAVVINPVTNKIYVANQGGNNVTVIDGATNATTTVTNPNGLGALAAAVNPVTNKIYVANFNSGTITVIDGATNTVTANLGAGTGPAGVAVNPVTNKIYVTNLNSANVTVIDGATNAITTLTAGTQPAPVAVNTVTNQIYVANQGSSNMTVIDGASNTVTATVGVGTLATGIAVNPVTNQIYVTGQNDNSLTVIDGASNKTTTLTIGTGPTEVAVNPVTNKIYTGNFTTNNVSVIDGATNATTSVTAGTTPSGAAVNPATNKIYVANKGSSNVTVIDGVTSATTTVTVGANPSLVAVNPLTNKIYVMGSTVTVIDGATNATTNIPCNCNINSTQSIVVNPVTNKIYAAVTSTGVFVIDGATNAITPITADQTFAIAVNTATNKIYLANFNNNLVSVVDGVTNAVITVTAGTNPTAVAVNTQTNKIYVANNGSNNVTVVDGATNTPSTVTDPNGLAPVAIAVNPTTNKIYVLNNGNDGVTPGSVTIIDGVTNNTTNVGVGLIGVTALAVNPVTNEIYVANSVPSFVGPSNVKEIDGATNTVKTILGSGAVALAVNPVTNALFASGSAVTVIGAPPAQAIPLTTTITPLSGNQTSSPTPTFNFTASSTFGPTAPPVNAVYFQFDTWQGPWIATTSAPGGFSGTAPTLAVGPHILYAYATDGQDSSSIMSNTNGGSSPLIGAIAAYTFAVSSAPPIMVNVTLINNGTSGVGTVVDDSVPQQINCTNTITGVQQGTCSTTYPTGAVVTFTETPGPGSIFTGWVSQADPCAVGTPADVCKITVNQFDGIQANFGNGPGTFTLTTALPTNLSASTGGGSVGVGVTGGGISCSFNGTSAPTGTCSVATEKSGGIVELIPIPNDNSTFGGYAGTCVNQIGNNCFVLMSQNETITPVFTMIPVTVNVTVTGVGSLIDNLAPHLINCANTSATTPLVCSAVYPTGTVLTLTETPGTGFTFTSFTGLCTPTATTCTITLNSAATQTVNLGGTFAIDTLLLNVSTEGGSGTGTVTSNANNLGGTINCGPNNQPPGGCGLEELFGANIILTAAPTGTTNTFTGWSSSPAIAGFTFPCTTASTTCTFAMPVAPAGGLSVTATFTHSTGTGGPTFSSTTLPGGAVTVPYGADIQITGGVPPYTFALANGSVLPTGFTLVPTTNGTIAAGHIFNNAPAATGTFTFAVTVTDSSSPTPLAATATISLTIAAAPPNTQPGLLSGQYALLMTGYNTTGLEGGVVGSLTFDGKNKVAGVADVNNSNGVQQDVAVTGTYSIGPDNRGVVILSNGMSNTPLTLAISVGNTYRGLAATARVAQFNNVDGNDQIGSGFLRLQDPTAFNQNAFSGTYAFGLTGQGTQMARIAELGLITFTNTLGVSGSGDVNEGGTLGTVTSISGTYTAPDKNGRIVQTTVSGGSTNTSNVAIYQIDANEGIAMSLDSRAGNVLLIGSGLKQTGTFGNSSLAGPDIISLAGTATNGTSAFIGVLTGTALPTPTFSLTADSNDGGNVTIGQVLPGTYAVAANGRGTLTRTSGSAILYLAQQDRGFIFITDSSVAFGTITPQVGAPFGASPFTSNLYFGDQEALPNTNSEFSGIAVQGAGNALTITDDESHSGGNLFFGQSLGTLNYTVDPTGHFVLQSASQGALSGYAVSPFEVTFLDQSGPASDPTPSQHPHVVLAETIPSAPGVPSPATPTATVPGVVPIGSTGQAPPITITNIGLGPLGFTGQNTGNSPDFSASGTCLATALVIIQPQGTCTIIVTFAPTANTEVGTPLTETLLVLTDAGNITISAMGTASGGSGGVQLTVTTSGTGTGTVTGSGITCMSGSTAGCTTSVTAGNQVTLTETPGANSTFGGWSSICPSGTSATCTFTMPATAQIVNATFTANAATLKAIAVTPTNPTEPINSNLQFTATGTFSDNSTKDITSTVAWSSSNTAAATINEEGGLATTGPTAGLTTTISATQSEVQGSTLLTVSNSPITITVTPPPGGSFPPVPPGGRLAIGLVLTAIPGFTGTVTFGCSTSSVTITCTPDPASVTFTSNGPTQVAFVVNTFCTGPTTTFVPSPGGFGFGGGAGLMLLTVALGGLIWIYRKNPRWTLSFAVLALFALGGVACNSLPKGPNGATPPGNYTITITATVNGITTSTQPIPFTVD